MEIRVETTRAFYLPGKIRQRSEHVWRPVGMNKPGKSEEPMKDTGAGGQQVTSESHAAVRGSQRES